MNNPYEAPQTTELPTFNSYTNCTLISFGIGSLCGFFMTTIAIGLARQWKYPEHILLGKEIAGLIITTASVVAGVALGILITIIVVYCLISSIEGVYKFLIRKTY